MSASNSNDKTRGTIAFFTGLGGLLLSIAMIAARKSHGQTAYGWLGTDDFMIMGLLFCGSASMATSGAYHWLACDRREQDQTHYENPQDENNSLWAQQRREDTPAYRILHTQSSSLQWAIGACLFFFTLSSYALTAGIMESPIPESQLGPCSDKKQEATYMSLYSFVGFISVAWVIYQSMQPPIQALSPTEQRNQTIQVIHVIDPTQSSQAATNSSPVG